MTEQQIKSLPAKEREVLYLYAYHNCWIPLATIREFQSKVGLKQREFDSLTNLLKRQGLIHQPLWVSNEYTCSANDRVDILLYMKAHDPRMEPILRKTRTDRTTDFYDILSRAVDGKDHDPDLTLEWRDVVYFNNHTEEPWMPAVLEYLVDEDYLFYVDSLIYAYVSADTDLDEAKLDRLCIPKGRDLPTTEFLADLKALYVYLMQGRKINRQPRMVTVPAMTMKAIEMACRGDYEEAVKAFALVFKIQNKQQEVKNSFVDIIPQYVYVMSLVRLGTPEAIKKLTTIYRKNQDYPSITLSKCLYSGFVADEHMPNKNTVQSLSRYKTKVGPSATLTALSALIDKYFGMGINPDGPSIMPNSAFLRHELSEYLQLDEAERQRLVQAYGDKPLMTGIHRKQDWEWAIEDILQSVTTGKTGVIAGETSAPKNRIIYLERGGSFEPKYQTILKSGKWSAPRNVSIARFCNGEADYMDDTDLAVAALLKADYTNSYYYQPPTIRQEMLMPRMVGSDRVYRVGKNGKLEKIEIEEARPYISITKGKGGYVVKSPASLKDLEKSRDGKVCARVSDTNYRVYEFSDNERKIHQRLLSVGRFPDSAAQALQQFLAQIADITEIQSPLLDDTTVRDVKGGALICLKVENTSSSPYPVSITALPLEGGSVRCLPGQGKSVYYDTADGVMVRVKRDLKGETANYRSVIDLLDTDDNPVSDGDYNVSLDADRLLDMLDFVKNNPGTAIVEWPKGKEIRLRQPLAQGTWNIGLKSDNGWFDIEGDVTIDDDTVVSMSRLLELISLEKGRYIRLGDNDFVEINKKLRRQLERLESLAVKNRNKLQISQFSAAALDDSVLNGEVAIGFDDKLSELRRNIEQSGSLAPRAPRALKARLRPYQLEGFQWMMRLASWGAGACLADDMGLGKTVQTIAFLLAKANEGPALITAPASVVPNWQAELQRFAPSLNVSILNKAEDRTATIRTAGPGDVVLSTYGLLNTEEEELSKKHWTTVCLDEAHTIKNRETKMSQAAMELQTTYRVILTGTPIQNHLGELWNLFRFINPGLLGSYEGFRHKFVVPIQNGDKDRQRALQRLLKPFMLRRTKDEVIEDLPDKTDINLPVELSTDEMAMYEAMRLKAVADLEKAERLDVNTLSEITRLRRAACAMSLVDNSWHGAASKVQTFLDLVADFKGDGTNRMLVFSQFTSFLEIVRKALDDAGEKYLYLDGSTTMRQREQLVKEFREGDCQLFLISLKAGGLGLNLPEANYVVHLDPWWNPAIEQQATDRAHRIGQKRNVTVYHLIARNTIEEKIQRLHRTKRDLADSLLEGADMAGKLTVKDILELITPD